MSRSPFSYLAFSLLFSVFIFSIPLLINLISSKNKEKSERGLLNSLMIGLVSLFFVGSILSALANSRHLLLIFPPLFSLVGMAFLVKSSAPHWRNLVISFLVVLAGTLYTVMFMYTVDLGGKTPTSYYEKSLDYSKEISGEHFPYYQADYLVPLNSASRFLSSDWGYFSSKFADIYNVTDRTPMMHFVLIPVLKVFGWNLFVYQVSVAVLSSLYLIPLFFLAKLLLGDEKKAYLATLLGIFSHFFLFTSIFGPSKNFTLFFILSAFLYLLEYFRSREDKTLVFSGLVFALAYLSHQFSFLYFIAGGVLIFFKVSRNTFIKKILLFTLPVILGVVLWWLYVRSTGLKNGVYGNVMFSLQWGDAGARMVEGANVTSSDIFKLLSDWRFWANKVMNFLGYFFFSLGPFKKVFDFTKVTLLGALTPVLSLTVVLFMTKKFIKENKEVFIIIALSLILPVIYNGFYIPMGLMWYALGAVPFFYILFVKALDTPFGKKLQSKVMLLALTNSILFLLWDSRTKIRFRFLNLFRNGYYPMILVMIFVFVYVLAIAYLLVNSKKGNKDENIG